MADEGKDNGADRNPRSAQPSWSPESLGLPSGAAKTPCPGEPQNGMCVIPRVPLFPLMDVVLFPGAVLPLHIFEQRYRGMAADALGLKCSRTCAGPMDGRKLICMCRIRPGHDPMDDQPPLFDIACVGQMVHHEKLEDGRYNVLLQGLWRVKLGREYPLGESADRKPYRRADLHPIHCERAFEIDVADARQKAKALCRRPPIQGTPVARQLEKLFCSEVPTVQVADVLAFDLVEDVEQRQRLLEETDERRRVEYLVSLLDRLFPEPGSTLCRQDRFA